MYLDTKVFTLLRNPICLEKIRNMHIDKYNQQYTIIKIFKIISLGVLTKDLSVIRNRSILAGLVSLMGSEIMVLFNVLFWTMLIVAGLSCSTGGRILDQQQAARCSANFQVVTQNLPSDSTELALSLSPLLKDSS